MKKASLRRNIANRLNKVTMPITRKRARWGRNWPCLCGSDKKYKDCCMSEIDSMSANDGNATIQELPNHIQELVDKLVNQKDGEK